MPGDQALWCVAGVGCPNRSIPGISPIAAVSTRGRITPEMVV